MPTATSTLPDEVVVHVPEHSARQAGIARGLNIVPGMDDDGWEVAEPVQLSDGSVVRLLKDGEALRAWHDAVKAARQSIFIETYIFADDQTGKAFCDVLVSKAREGVHVYLLYDSFGSKATPYEFFHQMERAGVHVREFHPIAPWRCNFSWRPFNRDHRKLTIIDGQVAGLGGLNIANEYGGSWIIGHTPELDNLWRDCGIGIEGPAVEALASSFIRTWSYVSRGGRFNRALLNHNLDGSEGPVGVLSAVPSLASQMSYMLGNLLQHAKRSICLTSAYFAPSDDLVEVLCRAARRKVKVRLMLPTKTDSLTMVTAARSFYAQLLSAGVEVHERQHAKLHAKTVVIDEEISVLGSTNFDYRSIDYNCELAVVIRSRLFAAQMLRLFEHDVSFSRCIDPKVWRRRPHRDRLIQWMVNRSRYLL